MLNRDKQKGVSLLAATVWLFIIGVASMTFWNQVVLKQETDEVSAIAREINLLVEAQIEFYQDNTAFTTSTANLAPNYLPAINNPLVGGTGNSRIVFTQNANNMTISRAVGNLRTARLVSTLFGSTGSTITPVDPGATGNDDPHYVSVVAFAPVGRPWLDAQYLRLDGTSTMAGNLDMGGNRIEDTSRVTVRTAASDGLVTADVGRIDTLSAARFEYQP